MKVSTTKLMELTGNTFVALKKIFDEAGVVGVKEGRTIFYESKEALPAIYRATLTGLHSPGKAGRKTAEPDEKTSLTEEKRLLAIEQRRKLQIENDLKEGMLVEDTVIPDILRDVSHQLAAIFDEIPSLIARANPAITAMEREIIEKEIAKARNIASEIEWRNEKS